MDGLVETSTPEVTPPPTEAPVETSIADHAAQFGPVEAREPISEPELIPGQSVQQPRERHRAKSQRAGAGDVPRIAELTKNWRTEQDRVKQLEAELAGYRAKPAAAPPETAKPTAKAEGFSEPAPKLEDFANEDDPYTAYVLGKVRHANKQEAWEAKQAETAQQSQRQQTERQTQIDAGYATRLNDYIKTRPDFVEKFNAVAAEIPELPGLLIQAVKEDDNGPAHLYHLLTHPSDLDDMRLLTYGKPVDEHSVALLRRRLSQLSRTQAVTTGSAVAIVPPSLAPRPPNPVRTGPMKTGDEPPGGDLSIADHAKHYGPKKR